MSNPGRNDPCPCGSGIKYKKCCLAKEDAKRGISAFPKVATFDIWQTELIPLPGFIDNDPAARFVSPFIMADGFLLPTELCNRPPADPDGAAGIIEDALRNAAAIAGKMPENVEIRHPRVAAALARRLGPDGVKVRRVEELPSLREAASEMTRRSRGGGRGIIVGTVETWAGWGLAPGVVADLFKVAADFHRAAPWHIVENGDLIKAQFPNGRSWHICVLGNAGETFGLDLIENIEDFDLLLDGHPEDMNYMNGEVIAFLFDGVDGNPRRMIEEIRREGWEIAGPNAYPSIITNNTPGYGIDVEHVAALSAALQGVPRFVSAWQATPPPKVQNGDDVNVFTWRDPVTGVEYKLQDFR